MKKTILTNNIYNNNLKNIYNFDQIIYSEKFTHLISDSFFYIKNDLRKSINLYYNISSLLKIDNLNYLGKNLNKNDVLNIITDKKQIDDLFIYFFEDFNLEIENDSWFEKNLKLLFIYSIIFYYKLLFDIYEKNIPYLNENLKLFNLIKKIILKKYNITLYFSYFFEKIDFLKNYKNKFKNYTEDLISKEIIIYYLYNKEIENLDFIKKINIKNNIREHNKRFEDLYYFKTNKFTIKNNNFIIYDLNYMKIQNLNIYPCLIEEDKKIFIKNNDEYINYSINNIDINILNNIHFFPLYLYKEYENSF